MTHTYGLIFCALCLLTIAASTTVASSTRGIIALYLTAMLIAASGTIYLVTRL